jgi:hypothetical protein
MVRTTCKGKFLPPDHPPRRSLRLSCRASEQDEVLFNECITSAHPQARMARQCAAHVDRAGHAHFIMTQRTTGRELPGAELITHPAVGRLFSLEAHATICSMSRHVHTCLTIRTPIPRYQGHDIVMRQSIKSPTRLTRRSTGVHAKRYQVSSISTDRRTDHKNTEVRLRGPL